MHPIPEQARRFSDVCGRRQFLRYAVALGAGALVTGPRRAGAISPGPAIGDGSFRIGIVGAEGAAARGAELGAEEASQALTLLGRRFQVHFAAASGAEPAAAAAERLIDSEGVFGLVGGFDLPTARALSGLAERRGVVFVNVGCADDSLRGEQCGSTTFHVAASERMRRDALAMWRRDAQGADGAASAELWHPELQRFGAGQLNERFAARFAEPLQPIGWANWMAIKVLWESAARARSTDAAALVRHLRSSRARFDGHKGMPLSFRAADHQLRQPLYLVGTTASAGGGVPLLGEVPRAGRGEERGWVEVLDQLGGAEAGAAGCGAGPT